MIYFLTVKKERAGLLSQGQSRAFLAIAHLVSGDLIRFKQVKERYFSLHIYF